MRVLQPILAALPDLIEGPRVALRGYAARDAAALCAAICEAQPHLDRWLPGFKQPLSLDDTLASIRQSQARWSRREAFQMGVFRRDTGELLGDLRLRPTDWSIPAFDIAYWLHPAAEGHGYASEAVRLAAALAFDTLAAQRLVICCDQRNARSRHVPERLGFVPEGCLRNSARGPDNALLDMLVFALTPADYRREQARWATLWSKPNGDEGR
jgi:RimJ/RimL family protein N-acetyltransferase